MTVAEAKEVLHISGTDNDILIGNLIEALPGYIEITTGMSDTAQANEPLVEVVSGFILTLWYYSDHSEDVKLQRTIDSLLKCITLKARTTPTTEA